MGKYDKSDREFTETEINNLLSDWGELIHSKSFSSTIHYDIYDILIESKYFDPSDVIEDLSDWELRNIAKDYVDEQDVTYSYLNSLTGNQLIDLLSEYNPLYGDLNIKSLEDEYRYKLCLALFKKFTSSFELEQLLGDDLVRNLILDSR